MNRKTLLTLLFVITALFLCLIAWIGSLPEDALAETALPTGHMENHPAVKPSFTPASPESTVRLDVLSPTRPPEPTGDIVEDSKAVALLYEELVFCSDGYSGVGISLRDNDFVSILELLAEEGLVAFDSARQEPVTNPQTVYDFFATLEDPNHTGMLTLFELCPDGGFLRHDLQAAGERRALTLTRLTWNGEEPRITYSNTYALTRLALTEDGSIVYDYYFPGNPAGGNHDGHVDTVTQIQLAP
jgi:hypothetical protein